MRRALTMLMVLVLMLTPACNARPVQTAYAPPAVQPQSQAPAPAPSPEAVLVDPEQVMTALIDALVARDIPLLCELTGSDQDGWSSPTPAELSHWKDTIVTEGSFVLLEVDGESHSVYDLTLTVTQPDITRLTAGTAHYAAVVGPADGGLRKAVLTITPLELYQREADWLADPAVQMVRGMRGLVTTAPFVSMYGLEPAALAELGMSLAAQIGDPLARRAVYTQAELDVLVRRYFGLDSIDCTDVARVFDSELHRYRLVRRRAIARNERIISVETDLNEVKTVVVECYSDLLGLVADSRMSYTLYPNEERDGSYRFGAAVEKKVLHLPYRLPALEKVPLADGSFWERDPRAPGEIVETLMQALMNGDKRALEILGGSPVVGGTTALDFVDHIAISDYKYSMLPSTDYHQMRFDLEITVHSTGGTVLREGTHRYLAVIAPTTRYSPGSYLAVSTLAPRERWLEPNALMKNPVAWPAFFISRFARFDTFDSPAELEPEALAETLVSLACATYGEPDCTQEQLDAAARRYFGLSGLDGKAIKINGRPLYQAERQRYSLENNRLRKANERVVSIQTRIDGRVEVLLERYQDAFQLVVRQRILYTMDPNEDGSYRVVSAAEQPLAPKTPRETAVTLPTLGPLTLEGLQDAYAALYGDLILEQADWEKPEQLSADLLVERGFYEVLYPAASPPPDYPAVLNANQRSCFAVPRAPVEQYLGRLFGVSEEQLRTAKRYDPKREAYLLGGETSVKLSIRSAVTAAAFSVDKSLLLLWLDVWLDGPSDGPRLLCEKLLTVRPAADGSFRFDSVLTLEDYRIPARSR